MENQKQTPIRTYSDAGEAKLREMTENPDIYLEFLKFHGRVFKHNANVALEFFVHKPDAQFIATKEQWERANRSVAQCSKAIPFMNKNGGVVGFYDFSQIEGDELPHRWTIHAKNAAEIKAALGIPANGNLISGAVQNTLTPSEITASMAALRVPPQEFRKFSSSIVSTVQCIISGRLEVGGSRFNVVPDASMFRDLRTESEKLGFLNLAANAARKILLKIERAALDLEAAERNERNERENQLREIHGDDRGRVAADSGRGSAGSSERAADEQDHSVESGTQGRSDGLSVDAGSDERQQHKMDADVRHGDDQWSGVLVQARSDLRTVQSESDRIGSIDGGRADREVRNGLDGLHGGALSGGNSGDAISSSLSDGGTVGGEISSGLSGDTGEGLREDEPTSDKRQLRGESEMEPGDGLLRGQHGDEGESLSSGDESLTAKLNNVFSVENNETSTDSADVFVLDEDMTELSDEEQLVQLTLEIKQGEDLIAELVRERNYAGVSKIAQELEELNRRIAVLKEEIQKKAITEDDIQALHRIRPAKKSIQNFLEVEVSQTTKFEGTFNHSLGEKSPYQRTATTFRENDEQRIPIIAVQSKECSFSSVKKDIKDEIIAKGRGAEGGLSITNIDTGWIIQISRKGLEDSVAHAKSRKNSATFNALYNLEDLMKNAVLLDATVSEHNNKNKSPDTLLMHKMYAPFRIDSEFFIAKITIEEFGSDKIAPKKRLYNLQDIKLKPLSDLSLTEQDQLHLSILNGSDISIAQLRELVKTYDKNFYENPNAPGREAREAELYAHAEYLDAVESAATGIEVTSETDKQVERIAEIRGIETEEAKAVAQKIVDTNINFSAGETEDSSELDISFSDKVHAAFAEVAGNHVYSGKQQKFLDRLEKFVVKHHVTENIIDEMAKLPAFTTYYGSRKQLSYSIFGRRLGSLERELTDALQRQLAENAMDKAIRLINEYCESEFDSKANLSNMDHVGLAYTTDEYSELPIEVYADLETFRIVKEYDGTVVSEMLYDSLEDMHGDLANLAFDELVALSDEEKDIVKTAEETTSHSDDVENEIVWTPILETADENDRAGSYSTKYNGKFYWISENADGGYDIETDFGHGIFNVGERYSNFPTRFLAEEAFEDYIEDIEQSFLDEKQALISVEIFGDEHYFKISDSSVDDILKTANTEKPLLKFTEIGEKISGEEYAEIQQSDSFTYSVEMNLDDDTAKIYMVNSGKGGISEADRTDSNVTFDTVKISDYNGFSTDNLPETKFTSVNDEARMYLDFHQHVPYPEVTPWGETQSCYELNKGIFRVSTASHGGIMIRSDIADKILSPEARKIGFREKGFHCYEEDCDACVPERELLDKGIMQVPDYYSDGAERYNESINEELQEWHTDYWNKREQAIFNARPEEEQAAITGQMSLFSENLEPEKKVDTNSNFLNIHTFSMAFGLNEERLHEIIESGVNENNLNEYGRFNSLLETVDKEKAGAIIDKNDELPQFRRNILIQKAIREFVLNGTMPENLLMKQVQKAEIQEKHIPEKKVDTNINLSSSELTAPKRKPTRAERLYKQFTEMFPDIANGTHNYERYGKEGDAFEPLSIEHLGGNTYGFMTFYVQNGDVMRDPDFTFTLDHENKTLTILEYQQDGVPSVGTVYQSVFDENNTPDLKLLAALEQNFAQNLKNVQSAERPLSEYINADGDRTILTEETHEPETAEEIIEDSTPELREVLNAFSEKHGLGEVNVAPAKYGN